jgi:hypothetical protein
MYKFVRTRTVVYNDGRSEDKVLEQYEYATFQEVLNTYETFVKYDTALFEKYKAEHDDKEMVISKDLTSSFRVYNIIITDEIQGLETDMYELYKEP